MLTDDDLFAAAVAPASLALVAANDDLVIMIAAGSAHSRNWRRRARVLTDGDFFAAAVAPASLALVAANDDLVIVIAAGSAHSRALTFVRNWPSQSVIITPAGRYSRNSIGLPLIPPNDDFFSIEISWRRWSPIIVVIISLDLSLVLSLVLSVVLGFALLLALVLAPIR